MKRHLSLLMAATIGLTGSSLSHPQPPPGRPVAVRPWYVWNNNGDAAYLRDTDINRIGVCSWRTDGAGYINC